MTTSQRLITILLMSGATMLTRFLPFLIFSNKKRAPEFIKYLGTYLPASIFALLCVYCFKDTRVLSFPFALPEIISTAVVIIVQLLKRKMLLSIITGTLVYMFLVQVVF